LAKTIYDIAKAAGVSIATVSRVFNSSNSVKESTREKILAIADEMGYHPQAYAQGLASKQKNSIMMLVPVMSNYFFTEILKGAQDMLSDKNIELNILNISQDRDVYTQVEQIIKRQWADGYLLVSLHLKEEDLKKLKKFHVPISLLDDFSPTFDSVSFNNKNGAYKATEYLIRKGYRRIAFLSGHISSFPVRDRIHGYKNALKDYKIPFDESLIVSGDTMDRDGFTEKAGYEAMNKVLSMNPVPDACFSSSDIKAVGALKSMKEHNKKLPMVSYDNLSISEYIGLTTIHQPMYDMGYRATKYLLSRIENSKQLVYDYVHEPKLIIRSSSEV
jgi:LacI family transcriptional regulator